MIVWTHIRLDACTHTHTHTHTHTRTHTHTQALFFIVTHTLGSGLVLAAITCLGRPHRSWEFVLIFGWTSLDGWWLRLVMSAMRWWYVVHDGGGKCVLASLLWWNGLLLCCNFLCVVLAAAYLKYRRCRLSCLPFVWHFFSLWHTHMHTYTHTHVHQGSSQRSQGVAGRYALTVDIPVPLRLQTRAAATPSMSSFCWSFLPDVSRSQARVK